MMIFINIINTTKPHPFGETGYWKYYIPLETYNTSSRQKKGVSCSKQLKLKPKL